MSPTTALFPSNETAVPNHHPTSEGTAIPQIHPSDSIEGPTEPLGHLVSQSPPDLSQSELCQGVLTVAIPPWVPQLSAYRLHPQVPHPFRSISRASAVGNVIIFIPHWLQVQSRWAHLLCFAPASQYPGLDPVTGLEGSHPVPHSP